MVYIVLWCKFTLCMVCPQLQGRLHQKRRKFTRYKAYNYALISVKVHLRFNITLSVGVLLHCVWCMVTLLV